MLLFGIEIPHTRRLHCCNAKRRSLTLGCASVRDDKEKKTASVAMTRKRTVPPIHYFVIPNPPERSDGVRALTIECEHVAIRNGDPSHSAAPRFGMTNEKGLGSMTRKKSGDDK